MSTSSPGPRIAFDPTGPLIIECLYQMERTVVTVRRPDTLRRSLPPVPRGRLGSTDGHHANAVEGRAVDQLGADHGVDQNVLFCIHGAMNLEGLEEQRG